MKNKYFIQAVAILGLGVLFFFPEPETNFLAYFGTALFFALLILALILRQRKKK